jgi:hypothetical protein
MDFSLQTVGNAITGYRSLRNIAAAVSSMARRHGARFVPKREAELVQDSSGQEQSG